MCVCVIGGMPFCLPGGNGLRGLSRERNRSKESQGTESRTGKGSIKRNNGTKMDRWSEEERGSQRGEPVGAVECVVAFPQWAVGAPPSSPRVTSGPEIALTT